MHYRKVILSCPKIIVLLNYAIFKDKLLAIRLSQICLVHLDHSFRSWISKRQQ